MPRPDLDTMARRIEARAALRAMRARKVRTERSLAVKLLAQNRKSLKDARLLSRAAIRALRRLVGGASCTR